MKNNNLQKSVSNLWSSYKVDEVCTLVTNGFVGTATTQYTNESDGVLYIQGYNITEGGFNFSGIKKVNKEFHKKNSKSCLKFKDLLTIQTGDCGLTSIVPKELEGANCHALIISRFKPELVNSYFVYYFYNSEIGRSKLKRIETGSTMKHINVSDLKDLELSIPTLSEQNRIVSVLEIWDKAIEKLTQKIEAKKRIKKGLMQDLLTGKKRLGGFNDIWKTIELGDVCDFVNGYTFKSSSYCDGGKYKIITIANVQDGFMTTIGSKTINELPTNITYDQILQRGDILVSMTGNVGRVCIVNDNNCSLNQRVGKIKPKDIDKNLLYLIVLDRRFLNKMIDSAQGGAQANLSTGDIKEYIVDIPTSKEEQTAIAKIINTADNEIQELEKKLQIIKDQKKYLLNNLITGTIRTPEILSLKSIN